VTTRVNRALEALAGRRASGILEIDGDPSGTVYFDQGQITCARASWVPDIGARLLGVLQPPAESLDLLTGADEPDRDIGTFLVQRNYLSIAELATILRSVVVDTVIALTGLADQDAFVSDIRFAPAGAHWAAAFSCLDVASVLAEARIRADRMARYDLGRTTPVRLHDLDRPGAVLSHPQWALTCAIDGAASAQDLAWRCGLALYEAIENLGTLIAAGLCQPDAAEVAAPWIGPLQATSAGVLPAPPASPPTEWPGPIPPRAALPRRAHPGPMLSAPPVMAAEVSVADGMPASFEVAAAPQDLLRRVLEGLRRT
jgi:hypothetical protein